MSSQYLDLPAEGSSSWKPPVATSGALPSSGNDLGDARVAEDTGFIYVWTGSMWVLAGGGGMTSPSAPSGSIQYNNSGAFGGFGSWDGTTMYVPGNMKMSGQWVDGSFTETLDVNARDFADTIGGRSGNWGSRILVDSSNNTTLGWDGRFLGSPSSLGWTLNGRTLVNGASDDGSSGLQVGGNFYTSSFIVDSSQLDSIDPRNRQLLANDGGTTNLEWGTPGIININSDNAQPLSVVTTYSGGDSTINFSGNPPGGSGVFVQFQETGKASGGVFGVRDGAGEFQTSANQTNFVAAGGPSLGYIGFKPDTGDILDKNGVISENILNRQLFYPDGTTVSINWGTSEAWAPNGIASFVWSNSNGVQFNAGVADWASAFPSLDTNARTLIANDGTTINVDWSVTGSVYIGELSGTSVNLQFGTVGAGIADTSNSLAIDPNNRVALGTNGTTQSFSWSLGAIGLSDYTNVIGNSEGLLAYDNTNHTPIYYNGISWVDLSGGPALWAFSAGSGKNTIVESDINNYLSIGDANGDGLSALSVFQASSQSPNYAQAWYGNAGSLFLGFPGGQPFFSSPTGPIVIASTNLAFDMGYIVDLSNVISIDTNNRALTDNAGTQSLSWHDPGLIYMGPGSDPVDLVFTVSGHGIKDNNSTFFLSIDPNNRQLVGPDGTTVMASWNSTTIVSMPLQLGVDFITGNSTTDNSISLLDGRLNNHNGLVVDFADELLIDSASAVQLLDWSNSNYLKSTTSTGIVRAIPGVIYTNSATATVANTTAETSLLGTPVGPGSLTIPANAMYPGQTIRITVMGTIASTLTPSLRIRAKLGSTAVVDSGAITLSVITGTNFFKAIYLITCRASGGGGTVFAQGDVTYNTAAGTTISLDVPNTATTAIAFNANQTIDVTAQWGTASSSNTISGTNAIVEILN